jgi:large subunit ribosomal protein L7/L12
VSTANIDKIVETLSGLSVIELANLKKALEDKWDVKAQAAPVAMAAAPAAAEAPAEESTEFSITLIEVPAAKKIAVIKAIRAVSGLGLKEAKEMSESTPAPIKESVNKAESEEIKKKFEDAGAKVEVKGL